MKEWIRRPGREGLVRGCALAAAFGAALLSLATAAARTDGPIGSYFGMFLSGDKLAERGYAGLLAGAGDRPDGPLGMFERALRQDTASAYRWCDLGEALLEAGQAEPAGRCMARALERGPHIAPVVLRAANFYYRTGQTILGLACSRRVLQMLPDYDEAIFSLYDRARIDKGEVLRQGVPNSPRARQSFLWHLLTNAPLNEFRTVWHQIAGEWLVDDKLANGYVSRLLAAGEYNAASDAWKQQIRLREPDYSRSNCLYNGGFEQTVGSEVFNWRIGEVRGAQAVRDSTVAAAGKWSLRIGFDGTENLAYSHVNQRAVVHAGRYSFRALVRLQDVTTDEGIGFRIVDAEAANRLTVFTERLVGTTRWRRIERQVSVPSYTRVLEVQVFRASSLRFDSNISGTVWIDEVALVPAAAGKRR